MRRIQRTSSLFQVRILRQDNRTWFPGWKARADKTMAAVALEISVGTATPSTPALSRNTPVRSPAMLMAFIIMDTYMVTFVRPMARN